MKFKPSDIIDVNLELILRRNDFYHNTYFGIIKRLLLKDLSSEDVMELCVMHLQNLHRLETQNIKMFNMLRDQKVEVRSMSQIMLEMFEQSIVNYKIK